MLKLPKFPDSQIKLDAQTQLSISIIGCLCGALISYLAVLGIAGSLGNSIGFFLKMILGRSSFMVPVFFLYGAYALTKAQFVESETKGFKTRIFWGLAVINFAFAGALAWYFQVDSQEQIIGNDSGVSGGYVGFFIYYLLQALIARTGAIVVIFAFFICGLFIVTGLTFVEFCTRVFAIMRNPLKLWDYIPDFFSFFDKNESTLHTAPVVDNPVRDDSKPVQNTPITNPGNNTGIKNESSKSTNIGFESGIIDGFAEKPKKTKKVFNFANESKDGEMVMAPVDIRVEENVNENGVVKNWFLPTFELLSNKKSKSSAGDIGANNNVIKNTLGSFGIAVDMREVTVGPTVSQYTLEPASGVRLSSIDALSRDLALALAAKNIRIQAPIPGKKLVGIEIPNLAKETVRLRDIIQTNEFLMYEDELPIAIGKDVTGQNLIYPLTKMPHLLVAGATGAGKSVWINGLLLSLIYRYTKDQLELIMVDMKRVELKLYDGVPHLLTPVITAKEDAINALKWTVLEMDKRYHLLETSGKRNIKDYNRYASLLGKKRMKYLVFVIDELGDLMMLAKNEVEPIIVRLTQMSRAVGIHMVLGTQRPDTQVITGLIKANVPTRIAFAVASQIDSRVILDSVGAEKLLGQGDGMLVTPTDLGATRFQGALVEEDEVRKCVKFLREQIIDPINDTNYTAEITQKINVRIDIPGMNQTNSTDSDENVDTSYDQAKKLIIQYQKASTSFLQSKMGIGYPKAAKIIIQLEEEGVVGPANGSKPRDVYIQPDMANEIGE